MKRLRMATALATALGVGVTAGLLVAPRIHSGGPATPAAPARRVLYWYDPMQPGTHFNHPGPSPLMPGMQLVPKYAGAAGATPAAIRIDPAIVQNLGMRTALVRVGILHRELRIPGVLAWDRRRSVVVSARAAGLLSRLYVRAPFDRVRKGQPLAALIAPAWRSSLAEYRALAAAHSPEARMLRAAARERLRVLGLSTAEVDAAVAAPGPAVVLRAPASGIVSALDVREGQQVAAGVTLLRIDDASRLWLDAAVPQSEVAGIGPGTPARVEVTALPGRVFQGRVEALLPEVNPRTRTETARIALDNPAEVLAPGMYATVSLRVAEGMAHPLVPDAALISTGTRNRVILALGDGRVEPRAVRAGRSAGGETEILAGLRGGEQVVTSGQFLIDSEADLEGALQRLGEPAPAAGRAHAPAQPASTRPASPSSVHAPGARRPPTPPHAAMPGMAMPASSGRHPS